jgi:hypothetical protein
LVAGLEAKHLEHRISLQLFYNELQPSLLLMKGIEDLVYIIEKEKATGVCCNLIKCIIVYLGIYFGYFGISD